MPEPVPPDLPDADLDRLERLLAAASLPWRLQEDGPLVLAADGRTVADFGWDSPDEQKLADAALVLALAAVAPALLAEVRRRRAEA